MSMTAKSASVTLPAAPGSAMLRRMMPALSALALAIAFFSAPSARAAQADETYVATLGQEAISILGDEVLTPVEVKTKFRTLLLDALDIRRVGLFALGQYTRLPTPEQKEVYFDLLGDFIVEVYLGRLTGYSNEEFVVTGSSEKGNKGREVIVDSQINFTDGREPLKVQWWLIRNKDGSLRVFDVNVAGIWMAQEQRGTFTSQIRNNGSKFEALLDHLRQQAKSGGVKKTGNETDADTSADAG